jgi:hypothetical protein
VFVVVEHWQKDIKVREQGTEPNRTLQGDGKIRALAPFRKFLIERVAGCLYFVAQGLKQSGQQIISPATRNDRNTSLQRQGFTGKLLTLLAVPKVRAMATLRKDEAL